jgi:preprotein translocase subunit SecB
MAKDPIPTRNGGPQGPQAGAEAQPQMRVLGQYIRDLSFESPNAPNSLRDPGESANLQVEVNVSAKPIEQNIYECSIDFKAHAKSKDMVIYDLELSYAAAFEMVNFPDTVLQPVLLVNCPAIMFPFLRRLVGDLTREGGFPPLWLDPIDWAGLYQQRVAQQQGMPPAKGPTSPVPPPKKS